MKITGCVITKDEEMNIEKCLNSLMAITSEIIVVDTGSIDLTVEIAKHIGASTYHFEWVHDFSKAKNYALSKATGDWIIFLDADEYLEPSCIQHIMECITIANRERFDGILSTLINYDSEKNAIQSTIHNVRIFRRDPHIQYFGAIHELIKHVSEEFRLIDFKEKITLIHTGYSNTEIQRKQKGQRNLFMLLEELNRNMNNHDINFYLSGTYNLIEEYELALYYAFQAYIENETELVGTIEKNYLNIIRCLRKLEYPSEQVVCMIEEANSAFPSHPEFLAYIADYHRFNHQTEDAILMYEKALSIKNDKEIWQGETQRDALLLPIYKQLSNLYYHTNDNPKTVHTITFILNIDSYNFSLLNYLIKILLNNGENEVNIINFLGKIYKLDVAKDLTFLLKAAIYNGSYPLAEHYISSLRSFSIELPEEEMDLALLKKDYVIVSQGFLSLFQKNQTDQQYLRKAIISSLLSKDEFTKNKVLQATYNSTGIDLGSILNGQMRDLYSQEELELLVGVIQEFYRLSEYEEIDNILKKIKNDKISLATAELFYQNKNFDLALPYFDEYLNNNTEIEEMKLVDILYKIGDCLYQIGEIQIAEKYIENAYSISQSDYVIYSLWLRIVISLKVDERIIEVAQKAVVMFPDSNYFISILESLNIIPIPVKREKVDAVRSILYSETYLQGLDAKATELTKEGKDSQAMPIIKFLTGIDN